MKKIAVVSSIVACMLAGLCCIGCTTGENASNPDDNAANQGAILENQSDETPIHVISREDGSGTRSAFIELFGVEEEDAEGNSVDLTTVDASITNSTSVMLNTVASDPAAIGYVSLGSLTDDINVKTLSIDGVAATQENILSGTYSIYRPFNVATSADASPLTQDFLAFILSVQGQEVVSECGYIPLDAENEYVSSAISGKIVVAGSSSVTPLMEKLKEAYLTHNSNAEIEIQQTDSTSGINSLIDGICDIGMASRDLKDSELEQGVQPTVIALDGIAMIVNPECAIDNMSKDTVKQIYTGELTAWEQIEGE